MAVTDKAAAVFFRAVARDRHPTPACTAFRTLCDHENRFLNHDIGSQLANQPRRTPLPEQRDVIHES